MTSDILVSSAALSALAGAVVRYGPAVVRALGRLEVLLRDIRDDTRTTREHITQTQSPRKVRAHRIVGKREAA